MGSEHDTRNDRRWLRRSSFALGCAAAVLFLGGLAEAFLRLYPPQDVQPYLGESSPLTGIYVPDPDLGVAYRSWDAFAADNAPRLNPYLPFGKDTRPVWAMFGNSFVQATGMLADTARAAVTDRLIFNLGRNEDPVVRLAQVKLLLANGLRPERIVFTLLPVDMLALGQHPLSIRRVSPKGALTYEPAPPSGPLAWLVCNSRLALTGWLRAQGGAPSFNATSVYRGLPDGLRADLDYLFDRLARLSHDHRVPVTVLLIPAYHQIAGKASFAFQDALGPLIREKGLDVLDPRDAFCQAPDPEGLFIPDRHFNERGNQILLAELLKHLRPADAPTYGPRNGTRPTPGP
jgi:hypothetical protein